MMQREPDRIFSDRTQLGERTALGWLITILRAFRAGLAFVVLGGVASAFAAINTAPRGDFVLYWFGWFAALVLVMVGVLAALRFLRRRRFGDSPPTHPISSLHVLQCAAGILAAGGGLSIAVPRLLAGEDIPVWMFGCALCVTALGFILRDAVRYVACR